MYQRTHGLYVAKNLNLDCLSPTALASHHDAFILLTLGQHFKQRRRGNILSHSLSLFQFNNYPYIKKEESWLFLGSSEGLKHVPFLQSI